MTDSNSADHDEGSPRLPLDLSFDLDGPGAPADGLARLAQFAKPEAHDASEQQLVELACKLYESRRLRTRYINHSLLGEPVWDMLLALYCFAGRGEALSVSGLCHAAGVPQTTALRWVQVMEQRKLVRRSKDSSDRRRAFVSLTADSKKLMEDYLATIRGTKPRAAA